MEAVYPELLDFQPFSPEWYRQLREATLARHPSLDRCSRDNLDMFVADAESGKYR